MWITIRARRTRLSPRMRHNIEAFVRRALHREQGQIASCVLDIGPAKLGGGKTGFQCRIKLWSAHLGSIAVRDRGDTIRTATQHAVLRARQVARRRLHKRRSQSRRLGRGQLSRWLRGLVAD